MIMKCLMYKLSGSVLLLGALFGMGLNASAGVLKDWPVGQTLYFEGTHTFYITAVAEHQVLFDDYLYDKAWITRDGKHSVSAYVEEYLPTGEFLRVVMFYGSISDGGAVTLTNEEAVSDMQLHVGIIPHGPGVAQGFVSWNGHFDGSTLVAGMHGIGVQIQPATFPFYQKDPMDPSVLFTGPLSMELIMEYTLME